MADEITPELTTPEVDPKVAELTTQLEEAQARINKYDGQRKDEAEQANVIANLTEQVAGLTTKLQDAEDEDTKYQSVTQEDMRNFEKGEGERFAKYTQDQAAKQTEKEEEYQKHLADASLDTKDEALFNEIAKEHDLLAAAGALKQTGNPEADAKMAWMMSENSLLRKKNAAGEVVTGFTTLEDAQKSDTKPVVPGQQELSTGEKAPQKTQMPTNLPDDATEFIALMGMGADSVNKALAR